MMKKIMALAVSLVSLFIGSGLMAQQMAAHTDTDGKFSVNYPENWTKELNKDDVNLTLSAPDGSAIVQVMMKNVEQKVAAMDVLLEMEKQLGYANLIPEDKRKTPASQLAAAGGGDDGALGAYRVTGTGPGYPVLQGISVVVKGNRVYILIQTIQEKMKTVHGPVVGGIAKSFRIVQ